MPEFSLILPVLDEDNIIKDIVRDIENVLQGAFIDYELILVENGSKDDSWQVLKNLSRQNKRIKSTQTTKGYGSAVLHGLEHATGEYVGYMPSDGQIDAKILTSLWREIQRKEFDMVKIKRQNRESFVRFIRSKIFNLLARSLFPIDVTDINGSPRIFSRDKLKILNLHYKDSFIDTEFAVKAQILGWKIKEIPMANRKRVGGKSTVQPSTVIEFIRNLLIFRFGEYLYIWKKQTNFK